MKTGLAARVADVADIPEISRVLCASWKTSYRTIIHEDYLDHLREDHWVAFLEAGFQGDVFSVVLTREGRMVGASILRDYDESDTVELVSIYLLPSETGRGAGQVLYDAIEAESIKRGYQACVLDVLAGNHRAIRFYHKQGYCDTGAAVTATLGERTYPCQVLRKQFAI